MPFDTQRESNEDLPTLVEAVHDLPTIAMEVPLDDHELDDHTIPTMGSVAIEPFDPNEHTAPTRPYPIPWSRTGAVPPEIKPIDAPADKPPSSRPPGTVRYGGESTDEKPPGTMRYGASAPPSPARDALPRVAPSAPAPADTLHGSMPGAPEPAPSPAPAASGMAGPPKPPSRPAPAPEPDTTPYAAPPAPGWGLPQTPPPQPPLIQPSAPPWPESPAAPAVKSSRAPLIAAAVGAVVVAGVVVIGGALWLTSRDTPAPRASAAASTPTASAPVPASAAASAIASAPPPPPAPAAGCRVAQAPKRIAEDIFPLTAITARADGERTLVGFASARFAADGASIDDALASRSVHHEDFTRPVFRVTPLGGDRFAVDHDDPRLRSVRTVPASTPFRLGVNFFGIVRPGEPGTEPAVVWEGGRGVDITDPGFAKSGDRFAVTFRRGVQNPFVLFGWVSQSGEKASDLAEVSVPGTDIGAPTVAANDDGALVLVTARAHQGEPRLIHVASAKPGATPAAVHPSKLTDHDAVATSVAPLPGGAWLVLWIDGDSGRLTARVLSAELEPQGEALPLTESETPILMERGAVATHGGRAVALYRAKDGRRTDLWAVALACE